jgi:hypothetical protein
MITFCTKRRRKHEMKLKMCFKWVSPKHNENTSIINTKHDFTHIKAQNTHNSLTFAHTTHFRHFWNVCLHLWTCVDLGDSVFIRSYRHLSRFLHSKRINYQHYWTSLEELFGQLMSMPCLKQNRIQD